MKTPKKLMPENSLYWKAKGYSDYEADITAQRYKGSRSKWNPNYWLLRGYTLDIAESLVKDSKKTCPGNLNNRLKRFNGNELAYSEWVKTNCNLSKDNMLLTMSEEEYIAEKKRLGMNLCGKRPNDIQYWLDRGYSEDEAKKLVVANQRKVSPRCVEYWVAKGFSEEDAIVQVSLHQDNCSLDSFVSKYGETLGTLRYNAFIGMLKASVPRCVEYWVAKGFSEEDAIVQVSLHQSTMGKKSPSSISYWLDRGYNEEESKIECYLFTARKFANCIQYWLDRGYNEDDAKKLVKGVQSKRGILGFLKQIQKPSSMLEVTFNSMAEHLNGVWSSAIRRSCGRYYYADFEFASCIVEVNGDYWHANPKIYGPDAVVRGLSAKDIWHRDEVRRKEIEQITGKKVLVIWGSEFKTDRLKEIIDEISEYCKC